MSNRAYDEALAHEHEVGEVACCECGFHRGGRHHAGIKCPKTGRCGGCGNEWPCADHAPADAAPEQKAPKGPKFIVREREFTQLSKPLAFRGRRVARFTPWTTIGEYAAVEDAGKQRGARNTGLFERAIFLRGKMVVDPEGRQLVCGGGRHGVTCTCPKKSATP